MFRMNMTSEAILAHLKALTDEWLSQFEIPPAKSPVTYHITDEGLLCVNGTVLFPARELVPESSSYEVESLYLTSASGDEYEVGINWPVAGAPYMAFVRRISTLYVAP